MNTIETRLVWNPKSGWRLDVPPMDDDEEMTAEQMYLGWFFLKTQDPAFVKEIAAIAAADCLAATSKPN